VAALALRWIEERPDRLALVIPSAWNAERVTAQQEITYGALGSRLRAFADGVRRSGLRPGDRVVLLFPIGVDLYALALALLASGLTVVMIDSGMGARRILRAIRDSRARAVVSVAALLRYRFVAPALWGRRLYSVDSRGLFLHPLAALAGEAASRLAVVAQGADDHALITFTSGSSGRPKGADRTHGLLLGQHHALAASFPGADREDVDLNCFPVAALHNLACGITTVLPAVDLRAPGSVAPAAVLRQAREHGAKRLSGAPAYVERLVAFMEHSGTRADSVRVVTVGGAPVSRSLCARVRRVFPQAACYVLYGSTEAEPMAIASMDDVVAADGDGYLVGRPAALTELVLVALPRPTPVLGARGIDAYRVPQGSEGEVVVRGPHVNRRYVDNPEADRELKLADPAGGVWHRTRDVGRLDEQGRLWLTGHVGAEVRHSGRVLQPFLVEAAVAGVPGVTRAALVAHASAAEGELIVEAETDASVRGVRAVLAARGLGSLAVRRLARIPVDRRHNSKIDRPALRAVLAADV
jgi:acyl-CoA synthetase (AMP-forming)/AMP-acid ligase II